MKLVRSAAIAAFALGVTAAPAWATTITFGGLSGANGAVFGPYAESGFNVASTGGSQWCQGQVFGNAIPSLFTGTQVCGSPTNVNGLTVDEGGATFTLQAFDIAANNGDTLYNVVGMLGGVIQFTASGTEGANLGFQTVNFVGGLIDSLTITFSTRGSSSNIDNIQLGGQQVPEPASLGLMGAALLGWRVSRRRRS